MRTTDSVAMLPLYQQRQCQKTRVRALGAATALCALRGSHLALGRDCRITAAAAMSCHLAAIIMSWSAEGGLELHCRKA